MRRYVEMVRDQPNNPDTIYTLCKYLRPEDITELISTVGVAMNPEALQKAWEEYCAVAERGQLP